MWEKYCNLSNKELFDVINNLENISLNTNQVIKDLIIGNYSIIIGYGKNIITKPNLFLNKIDFYQKISFEIYHIKDDIRTYVRVAPFISENLKNFITEEYKDLHSELHTYSNEDIDLYYGIEIKHFLNLIRVISKYSKLNTFA